MDIYINPLALPLLTPEKRFNILYGGRSSGKSWAIADILLIKSMTERGILILCVKGTMRSINDSVKSLLEQSIVRHGWEDFFYITDKEIVCKQSNSKFIFMGLVHPERIKSTENVRYCWIEEAAVDVTEDALKVLFPTIRIPGNKIFITFNPKLKTNAVYKMFITRNRDDAVVIKMNFYDNPYVSDETLDYIENTKKTNIAEYLHYFEGELAKEITGALWKYEYFKYKEFEDLDKIVVSIDPAGSDSPTADEAGIMVCGKNGDEGIVLEDCSGHLTPLDQAQEAIDLYHKWEADYIVLEKNGVGSGMKTIIKQIDKNIPVKEVNATRGKKIRALPIASLYQEGKIYHSKVFEKMEYELVTWTEDSKLSPGRLDSLVWALTELMLGGSGKMSSPTISLY